MELNFFNSYKIVLNYSVLLQYNRDIQEPRLKVHPCQSITYPYQMDVTGHQKIPQDNSGEVQIGLGNQSTPGRYIEYRLGAMHCGRPQPNQC